MVIQAEGKIEKLRTIGPFTTKEAAELGVTKIAVSRMHAAGELVQLQRGIYIHSKAEYPPEINYIIACLSLGPKALIGGLSALSYYGLTEQIPSKTWVMIPKSKTGTYPKYRTIRTRHSHEVAVIDHGRWRIASLERSIVEAFTYATKIGYQIALTAARTALRESLTNEDALFKTTKNLEAWPQLQKHWEAITVA